MACGFIVVDVGAMEPQRYNNVIFFLIKKREETENKMKKNTSTSQFPLQKLYYNETDQIY